MKTVKLFRWFSFAGLAGALSFSICLFIRNPGRPGTYELGVHLVFILTCALLAGLVGRLVAFLVDKFKRTRQ
jgi:hypothetical protein